MSQLERPLLHIENFISEFVEFEVTAVFAEIIDTFFCEKGLNEEESITQSYERDVFEHEKFHRTNILFWESIFEVSATLEEEGDQRFQLLLL